MYILESGETNPKKAILIAPPLIDAEEMRFLAKQSFGDKYGLIVMSLDSFGENQKAYHDPKEEALYLLDYLRFSGYNQVDWIFGASLGGLAALRLIKENKIHFQNAYLDSVPFLVMNEKDMKKNRDYLLKEKTKADKDFADMDDSKWEKDFGTYFASIFLHNLSKVKKESLPRYFECLNSLEDYDLPFETQKKLHFLYGKKDKLLKEDLSNLNLFYPNSNIQVDSGYGYLGRFTEDVFAYFNRLNQIIQNEK